MGRHTKRVISKRRSESARRAWLTRTRNEGVHQIMKVVIEEINPLEKTLNDIEKGKEVALGLVKLITPELYRESTALKTIDKTDFSQLLELNAPKEKTNKNGRKITKYAGQEITGILLLFLSILLYLIIIILFHL